MNNPDPDWIDPWLILNLPHHATMDQIQSRYRELVQRYHPDHNQGFQAEATSQFRKIRLAYQILSDPHQRASAAARSKAQIPGTSPRQNRDVQERRTDSFWPLIEKVQSKCRMVWKMPRIRYAGGAFCMIIVAVVFIGKGCDSAGIEKSQLPLSSCTVQCGW